MPGPIPPLPPRADQVRVARSLACAGLVQAERWFAYEVHRTRGLAIGARVLHLYVSCLLIWAQSRR